MKPLHYVQKYKLNINDKFDHKEFIEDITLDFMTLLDVGRNKSGELNIKGFENTVRAIRQKWDSISNKTSGQLPESLWKYFYATVIVKMREELFPKEMEKKRRDAQERERRHREYKRMEDDMFGGFGFGWFDELLMKMIKISRIPKQSFELLGLTEKSSREDVVKSYRELTKIHHPDKGGNQEKFIEITEAKNKCLSYLN